MSLAVIAWTIIGVNGVLTLYSLLPGRNVTGTALIALIINFVIYCFYETAIPTEVNIRVDRLYIWPSFIVAGVVWLLRLFIPKNRL